jgi:monovalent cation:H+ antiporter-2, CPA2 family
VAALINIPVYSDALVVLATAGVVVPLAHRIGMNPVIGYLLAGAVLGPLGLGSFIKEAPILYWFTVVDTKNVAGIADLGVVFLLFLIGLELSYSRLMSMRRLVFGLGGAQISISAAAIAAILSFSGHKASFAIVLGVCLALSSTALVLEILASQRRLATSAGSASFSVLLAQDLAVVPILIFISILGADHGGSILRSALQAVAEAIAGLTIIVLIGRAILRPIFRQVARTQSSELFIAAILFVIVGTGFVAALANMSMALGAFVAGLLLAETEYRHAIESAISPFKGLLLGVFFFTVGMSIDVREFWQEPVLLPAAIVGLIVLKGCIMTGLARLFGMPWPAAVEMGFLIGPGGEFAFVGVGLAAHLGVLGQQPASFTLAATSATMVFIPFLAEAAKRVAPALAGPPETNPALLVKPEPQALHTIVVGYGRGGKVVCGLLRRHGLAYTATDKDALTVTEDRLRGNAVYYGDAADPAFLKACGLMEATAIVVTINARPAIDQIVAEVRKLRPDIPVFSRARDADHAKHLYSIGVTDAIPETVEASLQLSEATLVGLGVAPGKVIASIHEQRSKFRSELQAAAGKATVMATGVPQMDTATLTLICESRH